MRPVTANEIDKLCTVKPLYLLRELFIPRPMRFLHYTRGSVPNVERNCQLADERELPIVQQPRTGNSLVACESLELLRQLV
jgi:hypothetical protein